MKRREPRRASRRYAEGRTHLVLVRDGATGAEQLALRAPIFKEPWQDDLAVGAASTVRALAGDAPDGEGTVALARSVMESVSRLTAGLLARAPAGGVACRAGCDHCCHQAVSVTVPEALAIVDHLRTRLPAEALRALTARVGAAWAAQRGLSPAERFSPEHPCPFLDAGRCSIYEVRPLSCRGMNSLDADDCARRLRDPAARAAFVEDGRGGRSYLEPIRAVQAVSAGLQLALGELYGLDMRPLDLVAVMHQLLAGAPSDASLAAWFEGQPAFESAVRPEAAGDPTLRELSGALDPTPGRRR
jgi:putative zinc- or iron-chelating protein